MQSNSPQSILLQCIQQKKCWQNKQFINPLTPNDPYRSPTAPLNCKVALLYIYSTNIGNEYFKRGIYSPFFFLQNAVCFIILTYLVPVLFTFYTQSVLKLKKKSGAKRLTVSAFLFKSFIGFYNYGKSRITPQLLETLSSYPISHNLEN